MTDRRAVGVLRQVGDAARASAPDAALLAWFAAERDEAAFAELVRRHGPTVLGVCRRVARHTQDAEDAFQAVFLVLAMKAESLTRPELLGNWLYGVAYRVARRARRSAARRRAREGQVATMPEPVTQAPEPAADLAAAIDDALAELPERFRAAVLLCDLHELPRSEAATRLGIPEGTLSSRLAAGRKRLADRLARRGVTAPAAGLTAALGGPATAVPPGLAARAVSAAVAWASGGVVPAVLRQLATEGGMTMTRAIAWATAACAAMGLAVGAVAAWPGDDPGKPKPPAPVVKADGDKPKQPEEVGRLPAVASRPRLVHQLRLTDFSGGLPIWSPDGTLLAVHGHAEVAQQVRIYDVQKLAGRTLLHTEEPSPDLGFVGDPLSYVTDFRSGGQINAIRQLRFWQIPKEAASITAPYRVVDYYPEDGQPVAFLPDGKAAIFVNNDAANSSVVRLIDTATGKPLKELLRISGKWIGCGLSPDGKTVVVVYNQVRHMGQNPKDKQAGSKDKRTVKTLTTVIESREVGSGKQRWVREVMSREWDVSVNRRPVVYSPDGELLAVTPHAIRQDEQSQVPFDNVWLLDAATGKDGPGLEEQGHFYSMGMSFSHDGRLLVGAVQPNDGNNYLRVWDTRTGKVRKTWQGNASATFAPDRPVLAILESVEEVVPGGKARQTAILGLWDVSGLVK